jgi:mono/diheme cytochrome c family protein
VRKNGDLIAPVMPYEWLHDMSDADALAVARYLKSQAPVHNEVKQSPNFTYDVGKAFFIGPKKGDAPAPPPRAATVAYGGYLAQHVGLCADCHTPRGGLTNAPDKNKVFIGDAHPSKDFPANPSNLTPDSATGIGRWTETDFIRTIRTGVNPKGDSLNPFMPWRENFHMTDDDLRAIYRYLRSLPAINNEVPHRAPANGK